MDRKTENPIRVTARVWSVYALAALLCVYILLVDRKIPSTDQKLRNRNAVTRFPEGGLREAAFGETRIIREGKRFRVVDPVSHPAAFSAAFELFARAENITAVNAIAPEERPSPGATGLDSPRAVVELEGENERTVLRFGASVEDDRIGECYLEVEGDPKLYVIREELLRYFAAPPSRYLDLLPFEFAERGACEVSWEGEDGATRLRRNHDLFFTADSSGNVWQARRKESGAFFDALASLDLNRFGYETLSDEAAGVVRPRFRVAVENAEFEKYLFIGAPAEDGKTFYAKMEPGGLAFRVEKKFVSLFETDFKRLAAENLFEGPVTRLEKATFHFHDDSRTLIFQKAGENRWSALHPYGWLFDPGRILNAILRFSVSEAEIAGAKDTGDRRLSVVFQFEDASVPPVIVEIFDPPEGPGDYCLARQNRHSTAALVQSRVLNDLPRDPFTLVGRHPLQAVLERSRRMVAGNGRDSIEFVRGEFSRWRVSRPFESIERDPADFMNALENSTCRAAMQYKKGVDFGFENPLWFLDFFDETDRKVISLEVGSYSNENEAFLLADEAAFLFMERFFLLREEKRLNHLPERSGDRDHREPEG